MTNVQDMEPDLQGGDEAVHRRAVKRVVLDTSLFVNPDVRTSLGATPAQALDTFVYLAARIPMLEFYMPPSAFAELLNFVDKEKVPADLLVLLHLKPPRKHEITCPGAVLYDLVQDMRDRVNRGLRIAEQSVRGVGKKTQDEIIQDLRRKYREALREGIIDSKEDVDILLLAKELEALLITADQGLIAWAEKLGIQWLIPERFRDYLEGAIRRSQFLMTLQCGKEGTAADV